MAKQTRREIEDAYLGDVDPDVSEVDAPESETLKNLIAALSATAGATAATGPMGGVAPAASPAPASKTQVKLYDDRADRPKMTATDYLVQALIPLGTGLLGGLGGGNRGAMVGVKSGLDAVGKEQDETDKRWNKLQDDKSKMRSHVITAKILSDMKAKDGSDGGRNKVRYIQSTLIDPTTKKLYYRKFDREGGGASVIDGAGNLVPYSKDLFDRLRETGETTTTEVPWPVPSAPGAPAPSGAAPTPTPTAPAGPKNFQGKGVQPSLKDHPEISAEGQMAEDPSIPPEKAQEGLLIEAPNPENPNEPKHFLAKGGKWLPADSKGGLLSDGVVPRTLPSKVKTPGGSNLTEPAPSAPAAGGAVAIPGPEASEDDFDRAAQNYRASVKPRLESLNAKQKIYAAQIEHPAPLDGENELDARRRVSNAQKQLGKVEEGINKLADEEAKTLNTIALHKADAKARREAAATKTNKPDKGAVKTDKEAQYRFNILNTNLDKLKALVQKNGTFDVLGPEGDEMDKLIYEAAIDYAKLVDPDSVAREGEVKSAQKYMLKFRQNVGLTTSKKTAIAQIDSYKAGLKDRLDARAKAGAKKMQPDDVDNMSDEEVEAQLRARGLHQ